METVFGFIFDENLSAAARVTAPGGTERPLRSSFGRKFKKVNIIARSGSRSRYNNTASELSQRRLSGEKLKGHYVSPHILIFLVSSASNTSN
jgi:hypothetical protein